MKQANKVNWGKQDWWFGGLVVWCHEQDIPYGPRRLLSCSTCSDLWIECCSRIAIGTEVKKAACFAYPDSDSCAVYVDLEQEWKLCFILTKMLKLTDISNSSYCLRIL